MEIRKAQTDDHLQIWEIFRDVIKSGDTYVFSPDSTQEQGLQNWVGPKFHTYVACESNSILGTYIIKQNQPDLGSHVANASYMVAPKAQGKGIGKLMAQHSLEVAKRLGFKAMQFNIVVSTNEIAVNLWKKLGFEIIGTIPKGFNHKDLGYVDAYIMYQKLMDF
ncbi:MAG: GNAT family N-acetyltransferase [Bdellovibrionaceae bacterium]|nr:GNAT family N-acetyltransferase [Pseudobdellovibrionaceae bacterium]